MAFLAFEGMDGSGKSTLIRGLSGQLQVKEIPFHVTREPGGTEIGEAIRELLIRTQNQAPTPRTELLLYEAIRAQHVDCVIAPLRDKGSWVLCDRFSASSVAFQEGGRGLSLEKVEWLNDFATNGVRPDLWVLLDLPPEESARRVYQRAVELNQKKDRFEQEKLDFHERVRASYLRQATQAPEDWLILDASQPAQEILDRLIQELKGRALL